MGRRRSSLQQFGIILQIMLCALISNITSAQQQQTTCLARCGLQSIEYPLGVKYGCGHPSFQGLLDCIDDGSSASQLQLTIPSGKYQVLDLDYTNQIIHIGDTYLSTCVSVHSPLQSFVLNVSGPLQLSNSTHFLFYSSSSNTTIYSMYSCINNSALCHHYPSGCSGAVFFNITTCCEHVAEPFDSIHLGDILPDYGFTSVYNAVSTNPAQWSFGFQLQYQQYNSQALECNQCIISQGVCGYNESHPFICICDGSNSTTDCSSTGCSGGCPKHNSIIAIIGGSIAAIVAICFLVMLCCWWRSLPAHRFLQPLRGMSDSPIEFTLKELTEATNNFSEKLGSGGFASVYKGTLIDGSIVAVKKLAASRQVSKVFRTEVSTLGSINHCNLVKLIGYCSDKSERLLVYEYMSNGSLDRFLFNPKADVNVLDWKKRIEIALGAAHGIAYLHEGSRKCIIHCDIKPANILLDENFNAKVADFGLAKLTERSEQNHTIQSSAIKGTPGYIAPEWFKGISAITEKSDVYSFGLVLLEILGGRKNADVAALSTSQYLLSDWAIKAAQEHDFKAILDPRLNGDVDGTQAAMFIRVSLLCIQSDPLLRPSMNDVVKMLEGSMEITESIPMPVTSFHVPLQKIWENADAKRDLHYCSGGVLDSFEKGLSAR